MKKKNPWVTAILNFLFYGLGFIYIGTTEYIIIGIILAIIGILLTIISLPFMVNAYMMVLIFITSIGFSCIFAVLGYVLTEKYNEKVNEELRKVAAT